ncbi:MAG: hypothetical protein DRI90_22750 [Deltaproteobacteria bacterium]|nr:MAG: hypothetical protein DRI90_22750 [Deltaproteobacteria bacterium]
MTTEWSQVAEVTAFKRDLWTIDLICIAFTWVDGRAHEIHEEIPGFHHLLASLPEHLKGFPSVDR